MTQRFKCMTAILIAIFLSILISLCAYLVWTSTYAVLIAISTMDFDHDIQMYFFLVTIM